MESIPAASFGKSHLKLIVASVILLVAALFMRGGLTLGSFGISDAASSPKGMTLAEAKAQARQMMEEKYGAAGSSAEVAALTQEQLAEVDPNYGGGEVLGASIGQDGSIDVDSVLNSSALSAVKINTYATNDRMQLNNYAVMVRAIESRYGSVVLLGALSTREPASLQKSEAGYKAIITELQNMQVPAAYEEYHRMKLVYYSTLAEMSRSMASDGPNEQAATAAQLFFSLNEKIESLGTQLESQYGVML